MIYWFHSRNGIIEESIDFQLMIAQEHVHIQYCVASGRLDGVAALYNNLGYQTQEGWKKAAQRGFSGTSKYLP